MRTQFLPNLLDLSAARFPERTAVEESDSGSISYSDLKQLADRLRERLRRMGVKPGDRVGMCLRKSADAIAGAFGAMKAGAAYVPVDPAAPPSRNAYIFQDCRIAALIVEKRLEAGLREEFRKSGFEVPMVVVDGTGGGLPMKAALDELDASSGAAAGGENAQVGPAELAYILYTSGSTGRPKGVMLSHDNAGSFIDWCSAVFGPNENDRFSSHAPLHFDLSILDLYVSIKHGAALVIVEEGLGKDPVRLAPWIASKKLTFWYSAPSILGMMAQFGKLEQYDYSTLRMVLFAGEVFPIKHLKAIRSLWTGARMFNLYGPTETNVCTYFEVPSVIPDSQVEPVPIGRTCEHCESIVVDEKGEEVPRGAEGELCIAGPSVLVGYWNLPERTEGAFLSGREGRWYRTGDIVVELEDGNFKFLGRRDRMVKKRGYRIELGEIEAALYRHPLIKEAAVIASSDESGVRIKAYANTRDGARLSILELKKFCSEHLPLYMIPDLFAFLEVLPKTSTAKIDYQRLLELP